MTDLAGAAVELYAYDAYGNAIGFDPAAALTEFLYSGEQFDAKIGQQYLRQRYYDPSTGRFNRLDPFFGNHSDPQSFHKYAYVHGDPIQGIDPSGLVLGGFSGMLSTMAIVAKTVVLSRPVIGMGIGAVLGGVDAWLGGDDILQGMKYGAAGGLLFGAGSFLMHPIRLAAIGLCLTGIGVIDSVQREAYGQAVFRLATPIALYYGFGYLRAHTIRKPASPSGSSTKPVEIPIYENATNGQSTKTAHISDLTKTHRINTRNKHYKDVKKDIEQNGIQEPIKYVEVEGQKYVVDGHHRLSIARELRINEVPVEEVTLPYGAYRTTTDLYMYYNGGNGGY